MSGVKKRLEKSRRGFLKDTMLMAGAFYIVPRHVLGGKGYTAPSDKLGLGFIGTGKQARGLASRFGKLSSVSLLAACDVDRQKLNFFKDHVAKVNQENETTAINLSTYEQYQDLLANDTIDAVIIATPDHWHAIMSIDAMKAGKDVFCEKPLAHTVYEGRAMVKAAAKYKKILQTGSMQRSNERFRHAVELVRNGYVGEIRKVVVSVGDPAISCNLPDASTPPDLNWDRWIGPAAYRAYNPGIAPPIDDDVWAQWRQYREFGGGILSDWGAHMFDIAQWALDMDTSGPVLFVPPSDPLAKRGLKMIYDNGIEMVHEDFERGHAVRFIGSEGTLDVSRSFLDSDPVDIAEVKIGAGEKQVYHSDDHYTDWLNAVQNRTQPICDAETGHRSSSVCNLANIAYQIRTPLRWDPVKEKFSKNKEANALLTKEYRKPYKLRR
ncbi:MAG: Gfo/Idh/MocA family oxidoreductase [Saprospiraceae bacterium]|nr:Gfo/Idh/MocA family oxidoreductase [Saprospiraceae bacterium]